MKFRKNQSNPVKVKQRFGLRKLKIGTVSVLLGSTLFFMGATNNVKADTASQSNQPTVNLSYQDQTNQEQTQKAVEVVQNQLGDNGEVQSDQAVTIDRTIQYQEQGTNKTLHPNVDQDVSLVPYYKVGHVTINYIDKTNNQSLGQDQFKGYVGTHVQRSTGETLISTKTNSLSQLGYKLESDDFAQQFNSGEQPQFVEEMQSYNVYFVHGIITENTTIPGSQTVEYVDENGKKLKSDTTTPFTFETTGRTVDRVTNKVIKPGTWNVESHQFDNVTAPEIEGYTPKYSEYTGKIVTPKPGDKIDYQTTERIQYYTNKGYQLKKDGFQGVDKYPDQSATYQVNLVHGTITKETTKSGSQTVKYVDEDGNSLKDSTVTSYTFKTTGRTVDAVTGKEIKPGTWTPTSHQFDNVMAPEIGGYTPEHSEYTGATVTPTDLEKTITIVYHKSTTPVEPTKPTEEVTITVEYIDVNDESNKVSLGTVTLTGKPGDPINYQTNDEIQNYINMGYQLVDDDFTGTTKYPDKSTTYKVTFKHATTSVTPENPGQPGQPTTLAVYAATKAQLDTEAEQPTVYYAIVQNGNILAQDLNEQQAKSRLIDVISPTIPGYRLVDNKQKLIDDMLVDAKSNKHTTITVYYTKDKTPTTPETPGTGTTPEIPTTPETPGTGTTPETPTTPEMPGTGTTPETPTMPETPSTGTSTETPTTSETPGTDTTPETPTAPEIPSTPTGTPTISEIPGTPTSTKTPDKTPVLTPGEQGVEEIKEAPTSGKVDKQLVASETREKQLPQTGNHQTTGLIGFAILGSLLGLLGLKRKRN